MVVVRDILNSNYALTLEDACAIHQKVKEALENNEKVIVDFAQISCVGSLFFNESLCKIAKEIGFDIYKTRIETINLDDGPAVVYNATLKMEKKLNNITIEVNDEYDFDI